MRHPWTAVAQTTLAPALLAALLVGCGQKTEAPPAAAPAPAAPPAPAPKPPPPATLTGFSHAPDEDLFGYYMPNDDVMVGDLQLDHISIGSQGEFKVWEGGKRTTTYAPIFLEFEDLKSPTTTSEQGGEYHTHTIRVLPTAYRTGGGHLSFTGTDTTLGNVQFEGDLDLAVLKKAQDAGPSDGPTLLKIDLKIGDRTFKGLTFYWFGGD